MQNYKLFEAISGKSVALKGIAYYPRPNTGTLDENNIDFFTEEYRHIWERDIPQLKNLGVNAIRIYSVDPSKNHDNFMCALQEAGIYAIIGLAASCQFCSVAGSAPPENSSEFGCYAPELKSRGQFVIQAFSHYANVIGFSAGNESHLWDQGDNQRSNAPCQKKFIRDMRAYIASCSSTAALRQIPVGNIVADLDRDIYAKYYNCQDDENDPFSFAEWYGMNVYLNCDGQVTDIANATGFQDLKESFKKHTVPVFLTEFGCLNPSFPTVDGFEAQRTFVQARALFTPEFSDVFAGGFVFEYSTEESLSTAEYGAPSPYPFTTYGRDNYGVGYFSPEFCDDVDTFCEYNPFPNYSTLQSIYTNANAVGVVNRDSFVPDSDRIGRDTCPEEIRNMKEFNWDMVDQQEDLQCATTAGWTCPNIVPPTALPTASPTTIPTASPTPIPTVVVTTETPVTSPPTRIGATVSPTVPPTTAAPTTAAPTTAMPTTAMPTTAIPTTAAPTTQPTSMPTPWQPPDDWNISAGTSNRSSMKRYSACMIGALIVTTFLL